MDLKEGCLKRPVILSSMSSGRACSRESRSWHPFYWLEEGIGREGRDEIAGKGWNLRF